MAVLLAMGKLSIGAETVTKWVKTDATDLVTGDVVVIVDQTSSNALPNTAVSKNPAATPVTLNANKNEISGTVADNLQWDITIGTDGSNTRTYQFCTTAKNTTNYLTCTDSSTGVAVGTNNNRTFTWDADNSKLKSTAVTRWIGCYNNQDWRCYNTAIQTNIKNTVTAFYKKVVEDVSGTIVTLSFPKQAYTARLNEVFEAPILTVSPEEYDGTIAYTSSEEGVATVASDGTITLMGVGETIITATAPAKGDYNEGKASYTLRVAAALEDGVFDFTGTEDYGSGAVLGTTYTTAKTFAAGKITITAKGNYCWLSGSPNTLRIYSGGTADVSAPNGYVITKIEITGAALTKGTIDGKAFTSDTEQTWEGEKQTVTIARGSATIQLKTIKVTYEKEVERAEANLSFGETTTFTVAPDAVFRRMAHFAG